MSGFVYYSDELLQPISPDRPCGGDLRYQPTFGEILEARRSDDNLDVGAWAKEGGRKSAEWDRVADICVNALGEKTKDLRIACFLTEAAAELDGFNGLRDGLRLLASLIERFWDQGLYPSIEDGDLEYRASALAWLNDRMPDLAGRIVITDRTGAENYGYVRYLQALQVGTEASVASGVSSDKRETIQGLIRQGWINMDAWKAALEGTKRAALETIHQEFDEAHQALLTLEAISDERFISAAKMFAAKNDPSAKEATSDERFRSAAPSFSASKEVFNGIDTVLRPALRKKQEEEAALAAKSASALGTAAISGGGGAAATVVPARIVAAHSPEADDAAWEQAQALVQMGRVDEGLGQMAALAAAESSGRARFLRKLALVDVSLNAGRNRLARTVLEELNRQIDEFKLEQWESTGLVGAVWSRLYKIYRASEDSTDQDTAKQIYNRLCRVDPWQAFLRCED